MARSNRGCNPHLSLIKSIGVLLFTVFITGSCGDNLSSSSAFTEPETEEQGISIYGQTQGTTYAVMCNDKIKLEKQEIDSILKNFDGALSTYIPNSIITKFNESPAGAFYYTDSLGYFNDCMRISESVFNTTNGAFDPSVFPLLEIWGFLKEISNIPDSLSIRENLRNIGFTPGYHYSHFPNEIDSLPSKITKRTPQFKIVFNAIAQGQAVDVLCEYLEQKGARNYFVEIGGEVRVKGVNDQGNVWSIGIDKPIENSDAQNRELIHVIELDGKAVATSGNYRQFYERDGVKYSHTLSPKTGYPVTHQLLSATVISASCALADGYATAFMVMGTEKAKTFIKNHADLNLEVFLVYNNEDGNMATYASEGFGYMIKK